MASQVRRWGEMHYVVVHCSRKGCDMTWKSSYFQSRKEAETYGDGLPARPRCLAHDRKRRLTTKNENATVEEP
jgi:hypothetical protein